MIYSNIRIVFYAAILNFIAVDFATAQDPRFQVCHALSDPTERVACYDQETAYLAPKGNDLNSENNFGQWIRHIDKSSMTDDINIYFRLLSSNEIFHEYDHQRKTGRAVIIARCRENSTAFIVRMDDKFLADSGGFGSIEYRVDQRPMKKRNFRESTDNKALGLWRGGGIPFMKELEGGQKLVLRVTPYNESAQEMEFDIRGINEVVRQVRAECKW